MGSFFEGALCSVRCWRVICLVCAATLAWSARYAMNPDGLSYLDLASETLKGDPSQLVNGYWSPGYPALISLALLLFRPSPAQEFPLVHLVNFFAFFLALSSFGVFLRYWLAFTFRGEGAGRRNYAVPFAFSAFLFFMLEFVGMDFVTPDLLVAAAVFLAAGVGCRLFLPGSGWGHYAALGAVVGMGYYVKGAMLPLGIVFLAFLLLLPPSSGVLRKKLLLSFVTFVLIVAPLVGVMSRRVGGLSFGEAGRLNYAWSVDGVQQYVGWTGGPSGSYGTPQHPPRRLMERPLVLEFASPVKGTYPLWYDPSYWYAGARASFDLRKQIAALGVAWQCFAGILSQAEVFLFGALVLYALTCAERLRPVFPPSQWPLLVWPLAAFLMYGLVAVEKRYLAPFLVLLCFSIYAVPMLQAKRRALAAVCSVLVSTTMITIAAHVAAASANVTSRPGYQTTGAELRSLGLRDGDGLAVVGYGFDPYYARYAGLREVAQIPDQTGFWRLTVREMSAVEQHLASLGLKAVVAQNRPCASAAAGWIDLGVFGSQRLSVLLLSPTLHRSRDALARSPAIETCGPLDGGGAHVFRELPLQPACAGVK